MSDIVASYLDERELGRPLERLQLKGRIDPQANSKRVLLCRTNLGLWLVAATSRAHGRHVDVLAQSPVAYRVGRLSDYLEVGGQTYRIPAGRGADALSMLRVARLSQGVGVDSPALDHDGSSLIHPLSEEHRLAIRSRVEAHETLLAWLPTATTVPMRSAVLDDAEGTAYFLLTDQRAALLAISSAGDIKLESIERGRFELSERSRQPLIRTAGTEFKVPASGSVEFIALREAVAAIGEERTLHAARAEWQQSDGQLEAGCKRLLSQLSTSADRDLALRASVALYLARLESNFPTEVSSIAEALSARPDTPQVCASIWEDWGFSLEAGRGLLAELSTSKDRMAPWALALHRRLHQRVHAAGSKATTAEALALADARFAEHLLDAGYVAEAEDLLVARLAQLPSEELDDLLPAPDADLTRGGGGQTVHIQLYELMARAYGDRPQAVDAIAELARLQPLVPTRLERLAAVAPEHLSARAADALKCLAPGGLGPGDHAAPHDVLALPRHLVEGVLPHPLARAGSALVGRLQSLLAQVEIPHLEVLRDYCERISTRESDASRALHAASTALGVAGVEGYISRGKKSIGTRAYEGNPSFVLVGGRHLDDDPAFKLSPLELRFALTAEVAHLRYEHTRVTSSELWAGALDAGKQSLDLALGVLPFLRGIGAAGRIGKLATRFQLDDVQKVMNGARKVDRLRQSYVSGKPPAQEADLDTSVITAPNEALIAAHRVMQLTADRAGLLLAGDLKAALRGMFLVRPDFRAELTSIERNGLAAVLGRRAEDGSMAYQDLAVRIAALITFSLSEDYARLLGALTGFTPSQLEQRGSNRVESLE